ncbi:MAG: LysR family transcriptional regulator [Casimicrobiaceae bacterium]
MDTELARTFLAVVADGNFVSAAERLHVSQSTVSTRIHTLEESLGCTLFVRNKAGAALTLAGRQFLRHASTLVRTVEHARQDVGIPDGVLGTLVVGGRIGLWEAFLLQWIPLMQQRNPHVSIRAESGLEPELMQGIIEGRIDIGVMYTPQIRPGLKVEHLFDDRLVMVSTRPARKPESQAGYVYVDWGPEFYAKHRMLFPQFTGPRLTTNVGWLGLQHILSNGGSGYFPLRIVGADIKTKRLHRVARAPEFPMPAYAVYPTDHDQALFASALAILRELAA